MNFPIYIINRSHILFKRRLNRFSLVNLLALLIVLMGCSSENTPEQSNQQVRVVTVNEVDSNAYYRESHFPGITQTESRAQLSFGVSGKVHDVRVDIGSRVKAGEVMASLDLEPYQLAFDNARSEASKARITLEEYQLNYERLHHLRSSNAVSQQDLEASRTLFLNAQASLHEANSRIRLAERALSQAVIRAPYDGVVSTRQIEPFEEVAQNQVVFTFDSTAKLIVESSIPVSLAKALGSANEQSITVSHQEKSFDAAISHIAERANNGLSLPIKLHLQVPDDHFLPPGIVVAVNYRLKSNENLVLVPHGAVYVEATSNSAFVYSYDDRARIVNKRYVQIVDMQATGYWIRSDLQSGEKYVAAGATFLSDRQQVRMSGDMH